MNEIIINNTNGLLTVSSLQVARDFEKRHDNVIRDIEIIISFITGGLLNFEETPEKGLKLEVSDYFIETKYQHSQNKQWYKCYEITRNGFTLLVMGFTGDKALNWKLRYIEAFNTMEKQLSNINASIEEFFGRALDERIENIVNKAIDEKVERIIEKSVERAVSETVNVLAPYIQLCETSGRTAGKIPCQPRNYQNSKMLSLPQNVRRQVDEMIISGRYSCQKIADFVTANVGISIFYMTVSRYIKKYFKV